LAIQALCPFPSPKFTGVQLGQRVAIYCRVSTQDQSCDRQERELVALAGRAGFEIVGIWKETASGARDSRPVRREVLGQAQARRIDAILVTELTRWGRSTIDLVATLQQLHGWGVSLIAQHGLQFDLTTPAGKLNAAIMAALAEFERDLLSERIRSGIAAAKAKGRSFGRKAGQRPSDRVAAKVLAFRAETPRRSFRWISRELRISKNTALAIAKRASSTQEGPER